MIRIFLSIVCLVLVHRRLDAQDKIVIVDYLTVINIQEINSERDLSTNELIEIDSLGFLELSREQKSEVQGINQEAKSLLQERILTLYGDQKAEKEQLENLHERIQKLRQRIEHVLLPHQKKLLEHAGKRVEYLASLKELPDKEFVDIQKTFRVNENQIERIRCENGKEIMAILTDAQRDELVALVGTDPWRYSSRSIEILAFQLDEISVYEGGFESKPNREQQDTDLLWDSETYQELPKIYREYFKFEKGYFLNIDGSLARGELPFLSVRSHVADIVKLYNGPELFDYQTGEVEQDLLNFKQEEFREKASKLMSDFRAQEINMSEMQKKVVTLGVEFELFKFNALIDSIPEVLRSDLEAAIRRRLITTKGLIACLLSDGLVKLSNDQVEHLKQLALRQKKEWLKLGAKLEAKFWIEVAKSETSIPVTHYSSELATNGLKTIYTFLVNNHRGRVVFSVQKNNVQNTK